MKRDSQLNILNRIARLRNPVDGEGKPVQSFYRLTSQGKLEYYRRGRGDWVPANGSIEDNIHAELARVERWGIAA